MYDGIIPSLQRVNMKKNKPDKKSSGYSLGLLKLRNFWVSAIRPYINLSAMVCLQIR